MKNLSAQFNLLNNEDLTLVYAASRKILKKRKILDRVHQAISKNMPETLDRNLRPVLQTKKSKKVMPNYTSKTESILFNFLSEDWSDLLTGEYDEKKVYYVYYHSDPAFKETVFVHGDDKIVFSGKPFYVGKGVGNRYLSKTRSKSHLSCLNKIEEVYPKEEIYHIFKDGLTEKEALEMEAKLINFFGCKSELSDINTHFHGFRGGFLINADTAIRPQYVSDLVRVKGRISNRKY